MKRSIIACTVAASVLASAIPAQACTTWVADTAHGVTVTRSVDWYTPLGGVAHVYPKQSELSSDVAGKYAAGAKWTTKYSTMAIEEYESFHGAAVTAINTEAGLSVNGQYMESSKPFLKLHKDSGAPAVSLSQVATYIASNYASVADVKAALDNNEFQIAWGAGLAGAEHGVHFSVQDKGNNKLLIQLGEGGIEARYHNEDDLRSMTNEPLMPEQREYVSKFDMNDNQTLTEFSAHISPTERNARLLFMSNKVDLKNPDLSWAQTEGKVLGIFDRAVLVPQDLIDPDNGDTYATWVSYLYNFDNGSFKFRNHNTYEDVRVDMNVVNHFSAQQCANLVEQADAGNAEVTWQSCDTLTQTH